MRWTCPHCKRIMSTPDEELAPGWRLVRCSDCKGFSMARKPQAKRARTTEAATQAPVISSPVERSPTERSAAYPAATQPRVLSVRREEGSQDRSVETSATLQPPPAPKGAAKPPVFIYGERAPRLPLPEPLPALENLPAPRYGRFAAPVSLMALGALVVFAGIQIRETHESRMAAAGVSRRISSTAASTRENDSLSLQQASPIRKAESSATTAKPSADSTESPEPESGPARPAMSGSN